MQSRMSGQSVKVTVLTRWLMMCRSGIALFLACELALGAVCENPRFLQQAMNSAPSENSSGFPDEESSESNSESFVASKGPTRWPRRSGADQRLGNAKPTSDRSRPSCSSLSHPAAPGGELAGRNGVGAPLRC
jgi:hypothetical protein